MDIMKLTWDKDPSRNANHGMLKETQLVTHVFADITLSTVIIMTHIYIYCVHCITLLYRNAQLHCHRHHLEILSIAFFVEGQKVAHFIKGLA